MAFDDLKQNADSIQEQTQAFINSNLSYYKLWGFKVAMKSAVMIFKFTLILLGFLMFLFFSSFAAAFAIGSALDNYTFGFLIVAGIYLIITAMLFLIKDSIAEGRILEKFSAIFFND